MKAYYVVLACMLTINFSVSAQKESLSMLVITGGHNFDRAAFFGMIDSFTDISYEEIKHPEANAVFLTDAVNSFDVILFYDMVQDIDENEMKAFENMVQRGAGLVFLHHSIVSYQHWDFYKNVLGGKYVLSADNAANASNYRHNVRYEAEIQNKTHPVTLNLENFLLFDEIYGNVWIDEMNEILISTNHPESMDPIVWCREIAPETRTVYIQPGHGPDVFSLPAYRQLLHQSIRWAAFQN
ncbi:MAG: ThuA domain-containing protein [Cyclobacteriaceae bacterium]|nr:ThuA domain-containing protein [Cyclobacteriaceae bacterium]